MPDALTVDIAVAIATLVTPAVFLALLAAAGWRRSRGLSDRKSTRLNSSH